LKKYVITILALSLLSLPSCFTKEIKKTEVTVPDLTIEEKSSNNDTIKEFDDDFRPCYYWELDEEKTTNVD